MADEKNQNQMSEEQLDKVREICKTDFISWEEISRYKEKASI